MCSIREAGFPRKVQPEIRPRSATVDISQHIYMPPQLSIEAAITELEHARDDIRANSFDRAPRGFAQLLGILESEPLSSIIASSTPEFDFASWWSVGEGSSHSSSGKPQLEWPLDLPERVAAQVAFVQQVATDKKYLTHYVYRVLGMSDSADTRLQKILQRTIDPLIRDLRKLSKLRPTSPAIAELIRQSIPSTGDDQADELLEEACTKFRDENPVLRKEALERLWDAWERLKTICDPNNKKRSAELLISMAGHDATFEHLLSEEAFALNRIGNEFQIRHYETGKIPVSESSQVDYFFHRCFAMIWLLVDGMSRTTQKMKCP